MSLHDTDPCNDSYVEVLNGYLPSSPSLGRYCNRERRTLISQTNHVRIIYHTPDSTVGQTNSIRILYVVMTQGSITYDGRLIDKLLNSIKESSPILVTERWARS